MKLSMRAVASLLLLTGALAASAEVVRVESFNVLSYNSPGSAEYNALVRIVQALDPDILLVQEAANDAGRAAFESAFSEYPYRHLGAADGGGNRQQTFSRWPLINVANIYAGGFTRPSARVDVDIDPGNPGAELRIYNCHWKSGSADTDWDLRAAMAAAIRNDINTLRTTRPDFRIIIAGDMNEEPGDTDLASVYSPQYDMNLIDKIDPFTGSRATRLASGRNIDHFVVSDTVNARVQARFIFNTDTYLPAPPAPCLETDSLVASDHLTIIMDVNMVEFRPGDMNTDGVVDNGDIDAFVLALTNPAQFRVSYPWVELIEVADVNADGVIDNGDIDAFIALLL